MIKRPDFSIQILPNRIRRLSTWLAVGLVCTGTVTGFGTFLLLTGLTPIVPTPGMINNLLTANGIVVLVLASLIVGQVVHLFWERSRGTAGAGLHIRLVGLFSIVALVPALLVAAFASVTLNRGLDAWFSTQTREIVETAATVADAYLTGANESTKVDVANIAADLVQQPQVQLFINDRPTFNQRLARYAALRNLSAVIVFNPTKKEVEANVAANDQIGFIPPDDQSLADAAKGDLVLMPATNGGNLIRGLMKLQGYPDEYLYVYRIVAPGVVNQLLKSRQAKAQYDDLLKTRVGVQLTFGLVYAMVALIFLMAAIWAGMWFSDRLVQPIVRLLNAARNVASGNFDAKVTVVEGPGDLQRLTTTFNMMTDQIGQSRDELMHTNAQLDERRRFTEAVLEGVSAGIIGIGPTHVITLANRAALQHLGLKDTDLLGRSLVQVLPEFDEVYQMAMTRSDGSAEGQVNLTRDGQERSFILRVTTELGTQTDMGHVLTFDDVTQLVSAQRNSAWSDIARRIAHEIKNPLTPIQLSAERLKRKYLKEIKTDRPVFEQCTDTIIRQVADLGRIVDEFSSFARMPKAVPEPDDLNEMVREATVLQRVSASDVEIAFKLDSSLPHFAFDRRLLTQAVTNLVKNAKEAIEARPQGAVGGRIEIATGLQGAVPFIAVSDNGIGLPQENRSRLAEPYMTTREKGTGLGLAIVKRIMEEHGGSLRLTDAPSGQGAMVTLEFAPLGVGLKEPA